MEHIPEHGTHQHPDADGGTVARTGLLDRTFSLSLILKGIDGVLELLAGGVLLIFGPEPIRNLVHTLTAAELAREPHNLIANWLVHTAEQLNLSAAIFVSVYLLLHGVVKVVLVGAVLRERLWAYPWMVAFLIVFIVYQCYQMVVAFSWWLLALTVFDLLIVWLTVREYRERKKR
ncbi:MAG: DUF2127 domain-containing protein [Microbacteriaceae bacterium]